MVRLHRKAVHKKSPRHTDKIECALSPPQTAVSYPPTAHGYPPTTPKPPPPLSVSRQRDTVHSLSLRGGGGGGLDAHGRRCNAALGRLCCPWLVWPKGVGLGGGGGGLQPHGHCGPEEGPHLCHRRFVCAGREVRWPVDLAPPVVGGG